ncbi:MAG TPA: peptidoglycan-binding protein, partial [Amaricoccus sp.]|nr:peptidoglycan-binding protein [Amaricoccus sp.]
DEQFCLARSYAIDDGASLAATAQGFTQAQIEEQCAAFAPSMREYVGRLVSEGPEKLGDGLRKFVADTGIPAAQLSANARICLGVGYGKDDADVALASALVLVGLGEGAYDELVGYHLLDGFGTPERGAMGVEWLNAATTALEDGATPLVTADEDDRLSLLDTVSAMLMVGTTEATVVDSSADATAAPAAPQPEAASAPAPLALPKPIAN